jgi:hypothetical protein
MSFDFENDTRTDSIFSKIRHPNSLLALLVSPAVVVLGVAMFLIISFEVC